MVTGHLVTFTDGTTVALLQVRRPPGEVKMVDGNGSFLGIDTGAKGGGRAYHHTDDTLIHLVDEIILLGLRGGILDESNFILGDAVLLNETVLEFLIDGPLALLGGGEVTEHELRALELIILIIILTDISGGIADLRIVTLAVALRVDKDGTQGGILAHIGDKKHLRLSLVVVDIVTEHLFTVAVLGKAHKTLEEVLMIWRGRNADKFHIHLRTIQTDIGGGLIIGHLIVEGTQFRDFNKVPETLLHDNLARHIDLVVTALAGKHGCPGIETMNVLVGHRLRTKVLEQKVEFHQRIADGSTAKEGGAEVTTVTLLDSADGILQLTGYL